MQLLCKKKLVKETYEKKVSWLFVLLYCLFIFYVITYGVAVIKGVINSLNIMIFFIFGLLFPIKQCLIYILCAIILLATHKGLYVGFETSLLVDIIACIAVTFFGIFCRKKIYVDTYPSFPYCFSYAIVLVSIYALIALAVYVLCDNNGIYIYDQLPLALLFRVVRTVIFLGSSFLVFDIFFHKENKQNKSLINIFIKKYNLLIVFFCVFAMFLAFFFVSVYFSYNYGQVLKFNFDMAKEELNDSYNKYGEKYIEKDTALKAVFDTWTIELAGGIYLFDENFKKVNEFVDIDKNKFLGDDELAEKNFIDIFQNKRNELFTYKGNKYFYIAIYDKVGDYYVVGFLSYGRILTYALVPASVTLFIIIINILTVFLLVYNLFKNFVVNRLWVANEKLDRITAGNYDVVFDDKSSNEFNQLSESINKTVATLKSNIDEIEKRNREELDLSRKIQMSQLPADTDVTIGYTACGMNIPAEDVGGDFYDNFSVGNKRRVILIADVSGKGIPAALFMMKAKHTIINLAKQYDDIGIIFERTNEILSNKNDTLMFVTCFAIMINLESGMMSLVNAGHNLPIIIKNSNGEKQCEFINTEPGHMLGIDKKSKYSTKEIKLSIGESVLLYTDGVTEAKNVNKELYGEKRLLETMNRIKNEPPKSMCELLVYDVHSFAGDAPQSDDITVYCIRYNGPNNTLKFNASFDEMDKGKVFLGKFISLYDVNVDLTRNLKVVYDEIICNIIKYAYNSNGGEVIFSLNLINNDTLEMIFEDKGPEFNPIVYDNNSSERSVDDKINGGMGIMFCKNIMDKCEYKRDGEYNVLKLYKNIRE